MKLGVIGDLHLTNRAPERRKDDYFQTILEKLRRAMDIFKQEGVHWIVQVGDFFNSSSAADRVKASAIEILREYTANPVDHEYLNQRVLCIWGQHDISGHSSATLPNSPLAVLEAARVVRILRPEDSLLLGHASGDVVEVGESHGAGELVYVYGASFGEDVPDPVVRDHPHTNILVTHRMIGDRPLYPGQPLEGPRGFLRKYHKYNLVICGDYHYPFSDSIDGRLIVNAGAAVRKSITDVDWQLDPSVLTIDLETLQVSTHSLGAAPAEEVFDLTREEKSEKDTAALDRLVESLRQSRATKSGWKSILVRILDEEKVDHDVRDVFDEIFQEIDSDV